MLSGFIHSALTSTEIDVLTELLAVSLSLTSGPWDLMWGACFVCSVCTATRSPWQGPRPACRPWEPAPGGGVVCPRVCVCIKAVLTHVPACRGACSRSLRSRTRARAKSRVLVCVCVHAGAGGRTTCSRGMCTVYLLLWNLRGENGPTTVNSPLQSARGETGLGAGRRVLCITWSLSCGKAAGALPNPSSPFPRLQI